MIYIAGLQVPKVFRNFKLRERERERESCLSLQESVYDFMCEQSLYCASHAHSDDVGDCMLSTSVFE